MKHFWSLPVALRLVVAVQHPFNVQNDLLAFPQYEVEFSEAFIPLYEAEYQLHAQQTQHLNADSSNSVSRPRYPGSEQSTFSSKEPDQPPGTLTRLLLDSRPYLCHIPPAPPSPTNTLPNANNTENTTTTSAAEAEAQQQELARASSHGWELLSGLQGHCLYYSAGWWVYSFCHGDVVKQFHPLPPGRPGVPIYPPVEDPAVASFVLGKFKALPASTQADRKHREELGPSEATSERRTVGDMDLSTQLQTRGATNYLVQKLGQGTTCDLTGRERRVEVQFHCNPSTPDRIHMIRETASCVYLMILHTPRLCNDVAFLPPQIDRAEVIACREIVGGADEEREWMERKTTKARKEIFGGLVEGGEEDGVRSAEGEGEHQRRPVVIGGIELGAQKLVGSTPELTIKASNIVKPPQQVREQSEKFIATLAKSDGKSTTVMSEREIKRLGIKGTKEDVSTFVDDIEGLAGDGKPWRLDVVQTPEGMQFRGILMEPEKEEEQDKRNQEKDENAQGDAQVGGLAEEEQEGSREEYRQN